LPPKYGFLPRPVNGFGIRKGGTFTPTCNIGKVNPDSPDCHSEASTGRKNAGIWIVANAAADVGAHRDLSHGARRRFFRCALPVSSQA
jgi:hypothetical protein